MNPRSLFSFVPPSTAPMQDVSGGGPASMPAPAFVNGAGGARLTPEQIAQRSKMAQSMTAAGMDYSPVGSWTQGLARVAQALVGKSEQSKLDKATAANANAQQQILSALINPTGTGSTNNDPAMLAAISSGYLSDDAKAALKLQWAATHKTPPQPSEFERTLTASGIQPGTPQWTAANQARLQNYTDPTINIPLPGGRVYVGPRSGFTAAMGGGDPASVAPGVAAPPATLPPDFDFDSGGPTSSASAGFR